MRGLWLEDGELRFRDDLPPPEPPEGEAAVRVLRAGICNTDLELVRGYYPYAGVPGHEFVGVVERGPEPWMGRRVVGEINAVCHACEACRAGRPHHCAERTVLGIVDRNGAFAERLTLPVENLHPVPDGLSTDAATFVEPLAAALQIREQVKIAPDDRVLVVGDGKLGLLVAMSLALTGCDLTVVGRHPDKLSLLDGAGARTVAAEDGGAAESTAGDGVTDPDDAPVEPASFDVAVEATGNPDGFGTALRALRPRGTLVMKSTYAGDLTIDAAAVVVDEITLVGSRCGPFRPALRLLSEGRVDVEPLVHARYPLEEGVAAFRRADEPGTLKVLIDVADA